MRSAILLFCLTSCSVAQTHNDVTNQLEKNKSATICYKATDKKILTLGREEWVSIISLNIPFIEAKVDTGAEVSTLDARNLKIINKNDKNYAIFTVYPLQEDNDIKVNIISEVVGSTDIKSSNGQVEARPVIKSLIKIGRRLKEVRLTLTDRNKMKYRMLLGKEAMEETLVEPNKSYCHGRISANGAKQAYFK